MSREDRSTKAKLEQILDLMEKQDELIDTVAEEQEKQRKEVKSKLRNTIEMGDLNTELLDGFAEKPYKVIPKGDNEAYVVVPRFVPFHVGHLHSRDESYNVFIVNKYVDWINSLPDEIQDKVGITSVARRKPTRLRVG